MHWLKKEDILNWRIKAESYEICFIPDNDYRSFLKRREGEDKFKEGDFVLADGPRWVSIKDILFIP